MAIMGSNALRKLFSDSKQSQLDMLASYTLFPTPREFHTDFLLNLRRDVECFIVQDVISYGGHASLRWPALLHSAYPELQGNNLCDVLTLQVLRIVRNRENASVTGALTMLDFVEFAAGKAALTFACLSHGLNGRALDNEYTQQHDVLTPDGLRLWLDIMSTVRFGGFIWLGTKCSSFVQLCLSQSMRQSANSYLGDEGKEFVRQGNLLMSITALIMLIARWSGAVAILEQPVNSRMPLCPPLNGVLKFVKAERVVTYHKSFGAKTLKPLQLLSSSSCIGSLRRPRPPPDAQSAMLTRRQGSSYTGKKKQLVKSQAYTAEFGNAVAKMILRRQAQPFSV